MEDFLVFAGLWFILGLCAYWTFWLSSRLSARRCPRCGSQWRTELVGEWEAEMWNCHACGHYWEV